MSQSIGIYRDIDLLLEYWRNRWILIGTKYFWEAKLTSQSVGIYTNLRVESIIEKRILQKIQWASRFSSHETIQGLTLFIPELLKQSSAAVAPFSRVIVPLAKKYIALTDRNKGKLRLEPAGREVPRAKNIRRVRGRGNSRKERSQEEKETMGVSRSCKPELSKQGAN